MQRALAIAAGLILGGTQSAGATPELEELCPRLVLFADELLEKHGERPVASFYRGTKALFVFANDATTSWTILTTNKLGEGCNARPLAAGTGWFINLPHGSGS